MNAGQSAGETVDLGDRIVAAEFAPVHVQREAHKIRRERVGEIFHHGSAVRAFVFVFPRMVVVHEHLAGSLHFFRDRGGVRDEFGHARHAAEESADADVIAAKDGVLRDHLVRIGDHSVKRSVGDAAGQTVFLQLFCEPFRFVCAGAGYLNGGVADVRDSF